MHQTHCEALYLCLAALLALSWLQPTIACTGFDRVDGAADCVRPEFTRVLPGVCGAELCALACAPLASCQAFAPLPQCRCKLFLFDACSHRVQSVSVNCTVRTTVFVRRLSGAAPGRLCPEGFSRPWFGTSYKLVSTPSANWNVSNAACSAAGGLAKFADATDAEEMQWLMSIRTSGVTYFLGGRQTAASPPGDTKANWIWNACNSAVDRSLWQPGEPNNGLPTQGCINFFEGFHAGIDDLECHNYIGYICECHSVFN